jgi:hypothetical protein
MARDGLVGDVDELLHAASHSVAILTSRSGKPASTLKIVGDAGGEVSPMDEDARIDR